MLNVETKVLYRNEIFLFKFDFVYHAFNLIIFRCHTVLIQLF